MFGDALFLLLLGIGSLLIQLLGLPLLLAFLGQAKTQPEWWAWGRVIGWLGLGLIIWLIAHLGIPINTTVGFWSLLGVLLVGVYGVLPIRARENVRRFLRTHARMIVFQEALFLFGLLFLALVRTFHPAVLDLEKFMNAGLMQGYLRSPTLPAEDFWLAGANVNYYSFGHFLGSLLLRFWHLPVEIGFNVLLGWVMGLVLLESFALGQTILRSFFPRRAVGGWPLITAGLTTAALIVFGGNSHPIWYWLKNQTFVGYWYPDVTRLIEHAIHEIPAYSFVVSDLHAHFWGVPLVLLTLFVIWHWLRQVMESKNLVLDRVWHDLDLIHWSVVLGVMLGVLGMTNTWDMLIYGLLLVLLGVMVLLQSTKKVWTLLVAAMYVVGVAVVVLAPWWLNFTSIIKGVFLVTERSPLWQLMVLWTGHVVFTATALGVGWLMMKRKKRLVWPLVFLYGLGLMAFLLLVLPEVIYFKDIYPTFPRANTMFKFVFQAIIMMNIVIGWLVGVLSRQRAFLPAVGRLVLLSLTALFVLGVLTYPFLGYPAYYDQFRTRSGLNGLAWLQTSSPDEYEAILWLRHQTAGRPVVLEAVGDSYTQFARVSVFAGLPTVMGWRAHEWLWRGGPAVPRLRTEEVKIIYEQPESLRAHELLARYQVSYIFIGSKERVTYRLDQTGLEQLGKTVFNQGDVLIIEPEWFINPERFVSD
ncbi:MAG: YYY membrane protein [Candidatus Pacebacteria bacterium GW2011_GWB1_47_8]|nr:MAG: YYY membrane protein [Candidatus Pacebacteria bacterium GW2011_GWA1_46_10]KKU84585.1 MAG: YYY membrane protein [Candidatus Pacebacteria bacterium GW2011_GWB1_47_8]HCR81367.1 hypothetical protein [Candidatus Paceibacterota bacterium]